MADRRRRRRVSSQSESELSEDEAPLAPGVVKRDPKESECESEAGVPTGGEGTVTEDSSEYESVDDEDDDDEEEDTEYDDSVIVEEESTEGWIDEERQSGDGEEQPDGAKDGNLDDDEDRKNPAYIPRRGAFYEHDSRLEEDAAEEKLVPKKKLWKDDGKWEHDRYRPDLQAPKSREELIAEYGYDIRDSDHPPPAPRRGRGNRRPRGQNRLGDFVRGGDDNRRVRRTSGGSEYSNYSDRPSYNRDNSREYNRDFNEDGGSRPSTRGRGRGIRGGPRRAYSDMREGRGFRGPPDRGFSEPHTDYMPQQKPSPQNRQTENRYKNIREVQQPAVDNKQNIYNNNNREANVINREHFEKRGDRDGKPAYSKKLLDNVMDSGTESKGQTSQNMTITVSNVQAPNTANFGADKKSYSRDRRVRGGKRDSGSTHVHQVEPDSVGDGQKVAAPAPSQNKGQPVAPVTPRHAEQRLPAASVAPSAAIPAATVRTTAGSGRIQGADRKPSGVQAAERKLVGYQQGAAPQGAAPQAQLQQNQQQAGKADLLQQSRPKRYSSQRQRLAADASYQEGEPPVTTAPRTTPTASAPPFYPQPSAVYQPRVPVTGTGVFHPEQTTPTSIASFTPQNPLLQQPVSYAIPVSQTIQSPPHIYKGPAATMATAPMVTSQGIVQAAYLPTAPPPPAGTAIINYPPSGPPPGPPAHYQMAGHVPLQTFNPQQGVQSVPVHNVQQVPVANVQPVAVQNVHPVPVGNVQQVPVQGVAVQAVQGVQVPVQAVQNIQGQSQDQAVHVKGGTTYFNPDLQQSRVGKDIRMRGGTTYFSPDLQHPSPSRSPIRRPKAAIPIVNPQEITEERDEEMQEEEEFVDAEEEAEEEGTDDGITVTLPDLTHQKYLANQEQEQQSLDQQLANQETAQLSPDQQLANQETAQPSPDQHLANQETAHLSPDHQLANQEPASQSPNEQVVSSKVQTANQQQDDPSNAQTTGSSDQKESFETVSTNLVESGQQPSESNDMSEPIHKVESIPQPETEISNDQIEIQSQTRGDLPMDHIRNNDTEYNQTSEQVPNTIGNHTEKLSEENVAEQCEQKSDIETSKETVDIVVESDQQVAAATEGKPEVAPSTD